MKHECICNLANSCDTALHGSVPHYIPREVPAPLCLSSRLGYEPFEFLPNSWVNNDTRITLICTSFIMSESEHLFLCSGATRRFLLCGMPIHVLCFSVGFLVLSGF